MSLQVGGALRSRPSELNSLSVYTVRSGVKRGTVGLTRR